MRVFVLLFNARTDNEGIHTVQAGDRNRVLMFESEDDATRFALLLEAQDFPTATVEALDSEEIEEFCRKADFDCQLVEEGMLAIPPETNLEQTDWQPEATQSQETSEMSDPMLEQMRRRLEGLL